MGRVYGAIGRLWSCSDGAYVYVEEMQPVEALSSGNGKHQKRDDVVDDDQINQDKSTFITCILEIVQIEKLGSRNRTYDLVITCQRRKPLYNRGLI